MTAPSPLSPQPAFPLWLQVLSGLWIGFTAGTLIYFFANLLREVFHA